jgi:hypothetical protein
MKTGDDEYLALAIAQQRMEIDLALMEHRAAAGGGIPCRQLVASRFDLDSVRCEPGNTHNPPDPGSRTLSCSEL